MDHPSWKETKYTLNSGILSASKNPRELFPASRVITQLVAKFYTLQIPQYARGRLLDLGCGKAPLLGLYRTLAHPIVCADWPNSLHSNPDIDVLCDLSKPLPFKDKSLDTIIISDVLEHISDPCKLWSEMSRILSPGGHIIGNSPFLYWIHEAPFDYHRMTPSAIELYIKTAGLELISVESLGSILDTWTDVTAKALSLMPGLREFGQVGIQALTSPFRKLSHVKNKLKANNPMPLSIGFVAKKATFY